MPNKCINYMPTPLELFKRNRFASTLQQHRKALKLSQNEMASRLANSHILFKNVTQSMISQWENAASEPPYIRRVGLAAFFQQPYLFDDNEQKILNKTYQHKTELDDSNLVYNYPVTRIDKTELHKLAASDLALITDAHQQKYLETLEETLSYLDSKNPTVVTFLHRTTIIGHYILDMPAANHIRVLSFLAINAACYVKMLDHFQQLSQEKTITFPIPDPTGKQFFSDIYFNRVASPSAIPFFTGTHQQLYSNPFWKIIQQKNNLDFTRLRFEMLKTPIPK